MKQKLNQSGQIVLEYILLTAIAVSMALIVLTLLVKKDSADPDNSGSLILKWKAIQDTIAND